MKLSGAMSFLADSLWEEQKKKSGVGKSGGGKGGKRQNRLSSVLNLKASEN